MVRRAKREDGNENVVSVRLSPGTLQFLRELQDRLQEATGIDWGRREVIEVAVARLHRNIFGGTRTAFENWIRQKGWRINSHTVRTPFGSCEPGQAVIAKKNGTWTFLMTLAEAWEQYCCSQQ